MKKQIVAVLIAVGLMIIGVIVWWQFGWEKRTTNELSKKPLTIALSF